MRTTLSIDDSLLRRAKNAAALQGKTLSELVEEKLRAGLQDNDCRPPLVSKRTGEARIDTSSNAEIWRVPIFKQLAAGTSDKCNLVNDAWLAALAIEGDYELITLDRDFGRFKGLKWRTPFDSH